MGPWKDLVVVGLPAAGLLHGCDLGWGFSIEVSFFPLDNTDRDPRNGCLGRALLEINIPEEDLFFDGTPIQIRSTRLSQTEASAFYAEGGDPGFTSNAVEGTVRLQST